MKPRTTPLSGDDAVVGAGFAHGDAPDAPVSNGTLHATTGDTFTVTYTTGGQAFTQTGHF